MKNDPPKSPPPCFEDDFRDKLHALFRWRRDVRRFRPDPLSDDQLDRLIAAACIAPSVGLSQPWRFMIVDDPGRRAAVVANFNRCNRLALEAQPGDAAADYARLKLAGLEEAPRHLAVFADETTAYGRGLGRSTMPEVLRYSVVAAICNLWLAARAEGVGVGWVSILDPADILRILDAPAHWTLIGYLCLGLPRSDEDIPELERENWERRRPSEMFVIHR